MDPERVRPAPVPTGDSRVDEAIAGLAVFDELGLDERPAVLEAVHDRLRELLGELDDAGRSAVPGTPGRRGEQGELGGGGLAPRHAQSGQQGGMQGGPQGGQRR
jgi:hypothetical protein